MAMGVFAHKSVQEFGANGDFAQTINNLETSGGLSTLLKQRIADTKVAIVGCMAVEHIAEAITRLGFVDIVSVPDCTDLPVCDVVICICTEK